MIKIISIISAIASLVLSRSIPPTLHFKLFYETLCPYCQRFMVDQVAPIVDDPETAKFVDLDLELIPYGNVRNGKCQHGPIECEGNAYHRCIIDVLDYDPAKYLPAILCMEEAFKNYNFTGMDHAPMGHFGLMCVKEGTHFDVSTWCEVHRCYSSPERSAKLEEAARKETESLDPPKQFVPWITDIEGHQLPDAHADFKGYVCDYLRNNSYAMPPVCRPTISLNFEGAMSMKRESYA
ncbi:Gamma-interferon-inducible lysosomal thiol reductase precursor, putative [Perkinsus marinus ATCC 50983]|uniref:Gamma-interferon-inducible lysosomal thiol reductase, putative n=1 Tax=Perkinsus marinus (strain ATCC 50983 / TXsc) TaxID=423536 RepID=C5KDN4_PERM5|nr:Gamma-interferon-inducible lysosomal thiol reductase precursor, putative [Perkinsus marinus ATCC 50983]EER17337.1 Gamma-interferon-inducible lysosomal thiol reductase precursor, putative [Perkinsus marinus ATCC 50983]|eukprot:XP_002785541.1 Gamma-interferon-inducible lysosomal thiol reductase precursor, putative [Perkinsus marinus ATCC 50983]